MELVVDTNVLISALVKPALSRDLLMNPDLSLFSPDSAIFEILKHEVELTAKSGLSAQELRAFVAALLSKITIVPAEEFTSSLREALKIAPHPEDAPFLALCLSKKISLWSNDKTLGRQNRVKVLTTQELVKLL